jgi:5'(3')-deoxyribonucleotidase
MKVGVALDGLLCDTAQLDAEWSARLGPDFIRDETFWGALVPYADAGRGLRTLTVNHQVYVFAERPKAYSLVTRAWIRNNFNVLLGPENLVMQALKRYDCRLLGIDAFIDSNVRDLENLSVETVRPVRPYHVDRTRGQSLLTVIESLDEGVCLRD